MQVVLICHGLSDCNRNFSSCNNAMLTCQLLCIKDMTLLSNQPQRKQNTFWSFKAPMKITILYNSNPWLCFIAMCLKTYWNDAESRGRLSALCSIWTHHSVLSHPCSHLKPFFIKNGLEFMFFANFSFDLAVNQAKNPSFCIAFGATCAGGVCTSHTDLGAVPSMRRFDLYDALVYYEILSSWVRHKNRTKLGAHNREKLLG